MDCLAQPTPLREQIERLQAEMRAMPQSMPPVTNHFADGVYGREMLIPAGTLIVGKVHAKQHLFVVTRGDMSIATEEGVIRVRAGFVHVGQPGTKRAAYAHEDTVCIAISPNPQNIQDMDALEAFLIVPEALSAPEVQGVLQ